MLLKQLGWEKGMKQKQIASLNLIAHEALLATDGFSVKSRRRMKLGTPSVGHAIRRNSSSNPPKRRERLRAPYGKTSLICLSRCRRMQGRMWLGSTCLIYL